MRSRDDHERPRVDHRPDRRRLLALSGALATGAMAGCLGGVRPDGGSREANAATRGPSTPAADPDIDDDRLRALVERTNGVTVDLYEQLVAADPDANVVASPIGVSIALAMVYAGARGETRRQLRETLRYSPGDDDRPPDEVLHETFNALQRALKERGEDDEATGDGDGRDDDDRLPFQLSIGNGLWGQAGVPFDEAYLDLLADHYWAGLNEVDFESNPGAAREAINAWVADATEDRIDDLLPEGSIDEFTRLVLVNVVYFVAEWARPFPEDGTQRRPFRALDGTEHEVPLMEEEGTWNYADVDGVQAVELPYVGEDVSMVVILPPDGEFGTFEDDLDADRIDALVDALAFGEGRVALPRFEYESGFELERAFEAMGLTEPFDATADFGGMIDDDHERDLAIDGVYHDARIAVDEAGTEAAAATAVDAVQPISQPEPAFEFVADRPFCYVLRDRPTGAILFVGRVVDPDGWA